MKQPVNQHKRMAMGGNARGYAMGGAVVPPRPLGAPPMRPPPTGGPGGVPAMSGPPARMKSGGGVKAPALLKTGTPMSPITKSKMGNGIPGMKRGGRA